MCCVVERTRVVCVSVWCCLTRARALALCVCARARARETRTACGVCVCEREWSVCVRACVLCVVMQLNMKLLFQLRELFVKDSILLD